MATALLAVAASGCSDSGTDSPGPTGGTAGVPGGGGNGGSTAGSSNVGGSSGAAGTSATAGNGGTAGSSGNGGAGGSGGAAGSGGGAAGSGGTGGGSAYVACPADKTFCSGFEEAAQPAGSTYLYNAAPGEWTRDFEVDTTVFRHGKSSLKVKGAGGTGALQMLAVPTPTGPFWVRFYVRQDEMDIGGIKHNVYAGAADSATPNSTVMVEVAEDVGLAFNSHDKVAWPKDHGRILGQETPYTLAKGMWHCIEVHYDGQARTQKLYVGGVETINAAEFPEAAVSFTHFKFGMNALNGPQRAVWYDDVAVGPTRPGCAP